MLCALNFYVDLNKLAELGILWLAILRFNERCFTFVKRFYFYDVGKLCVPCCTIEICEVLRGLANKELTEFDILCFSYSSFWNKLSRSYISVSKAFAALNERLELGLQICSFGGVSHELPWTSEVSSISSDVWFDQERMNEWKVWKTSQSGSIFSRHEQKPNSNC